MIHACKKPELLQQAQEEEILTLFEARGRRKISLETKWGCKSKICLMMSECDEGITSSSCLICVIMKGFTQIKMMNKLLSRYICVPYFESYVKFTYRHGRIYFPFPYVTVINITFIV